jgi:hypothetical protein
VPRMEAAEMRIKRTMASFTDAKKDQTGFLFDKIANLSIRHGIGSKRRKIKL